MPPSSPSSESLAALVPFRTHLIVSFLLRFMFILYGEHHDRNQLVKYTDVDYRDGKKDCHSLRELAPEAKEARPQDHAT